MNNEEELKKEETVEEEEYTEEDDLSESEIKYREEQEKTIINFNFYSYFTYRIGIKLCIIY